MKAFPSTAIFSLLMGLNLSARPLAFPTAQGFGANASGGRGGTVYHVTNLNESGAGSFADACSRTNRTVVFNVGGVITIHDRINVADNITIAGQTAPGDGIVVYGYGIITNGRNIIIRHLTILGSIKMSDGKCTLTWDGSNNVIYDHCTIGWGRWDCIHITNSTDVTMQYCIIAEGIDPQRFGAITDGTRNWTVHHNLWINQKSRNPKMKCFLQYINNIVYNYGCCGIVGGHSGADHYQDVINNYFIAGPSSSTTFLTEWDKTDKVYHSGNFADLDKDGTLNGKAVTDADFLSAGGSSYAGATIRNSPYLTSPVPVIVESAADAFETVLNEAGSSLHRLSINDRLRNHLKSLGTEGALIDSEADVGGVETVEGGTAPTDTDRDGMPDTWEKAHDLDPDNADDRNGTQLSPDGYTNLEVYLNELAAGGTTASGDTNERGVKKEGYAGKTVTSRFTGDALILHAPEKMDASIKLVNAAGRLFWSRSNVTIPRGETVFSLSKKGILPFSQGIVIVCIENEDGEYRMVINKGE
ncbi:MAG: hypothetical protein JW863_13505 [Chitinispirillaceae bacterium]|nr:hypothetical protein [Chitinispirillaceae bacterium]